MCPCKADTNLTYDHVTDSDFEDDVQEKVVSQYYSYVDSAMLRSSNDSIVMEETRMNGPMDQGHDPREFMRQLSRHRRN